MKAEELDKKFDDNEEDIIEYLDLSKAHRPGMRCFRNAKSKRPVFRAVKGTRSFSTPIVNRMRRRKTKH